MTPGVSPGAALVLLAAGNSTRTGLATNKVFAVLGGRRVLGWSLAAVRDDPRIGAVVLVVRAEDTQVAADVVREEGWDRRVRFVPGGRTRHASEWNALCALADEVRSGAVDAIAIHDAARPLAPATLFGDVISVARQHGGAVPGRIQPALLHRPDLHPYAGEAVAVQTPQAFRARPLLAAYEAAAREGFEGSDTAACLERFAPELRVRHLPGPASNLKVTFAEDLAAAESLLRRRIGSDRAALHAGQHRQDGQIVGVADPPAG